MQGPVVFQFLVLDPERRFAVFLLYPSTSRRSLLRRALKGVPCELFRVCGVAKLPPQRLRARFEAAAKAQGLTLEDLDPLPGRSRQ